MISENAKIYPNVKLGKNVVIEDFCVIGAGLQRGMNEKTIIGDNAVIRSHTVIYAGNKIGKNFHAGNKANIRELNIIKDNVSIGSHTVIEHHVRIEENVRIHSQAFVCEKTILKKNCWIGPGVVFTNSKYPQSPSAKKSLKGVIVKENAKIGAGVTILPGVRIGKNSLIGAGSVVTKNTKDNSVYAGNPAKFLKGALYLKGAK